MSDHPFHGIALVIIRSGNGDWKVVTQHRLPKRGPDISVRIRTIEKQLSYLSISNAISSYRTEQRLSHSPSCPICTRNAQGESKPVLELRQKTLVLTNVFKNEMLVCTWTLPLSELDKFVPHFDRNPDAVSHSESPHLTSHKYECFERLQGALIPAFPSRGTPASNATSSGILKSRI